jgi:hypothetical protein
MIGKLPMVGMMQQISNVVSGMALHVLLMEQKQI